MGTVKRREREKEQTRQRIVDAARLLFATEGYEAVSMRRIADAIEYTPTAIYVHFADKADLFREVCRQDFAKLATAERELRDVPDPIDRIAAIGRRYVEFGVRHPNHYRLMFMTEHHHHAAPPTEVDLERKHDPDADAYAMLRLAVDEAMAAGRFRPDVSDPGLISQTLWAAMHGVASLAITKCDDDWLTWAPLAQRVDLMVSAILTGLTAGAAGAPKRKKQKGGAR